MAPLRGAIGSDKELEHVKTTYSTKRNAINQIKQALRRSLSDPLYLVAKGANMDSENIAVLTGRGFQTNLEASVVCDAIEKSNLDPSVKDILKGAILDRLIDNGFIKIEEFMAWVYEQFPEGSTVIESINSIINSLLP